MLTPAQTIEIRVNRNGSNFLLVGTRPTLTCLVLTLQFHVECCFTSTEAVQTIGDGEPCGTAISTFT